MDRDGVGMFLYVCGRIIIISNMDNVLEQKRGRTYRKHILLPDKILVETRTLSKNTKYEVKLDRIGNDIQYQSESDKGHKIWFYFFLIMPLILLSLSITGQMPQYKLGFIIFISSLSFLCAMLRFIKKPQDDIFLAGGQNNLVFFRTIPNEERVLEFINQIQEAKKNYIKEKHAKVDVHLPEEVFIGKLNWLKSIEIIDETEFEELLNEYKIKKLF